MKMYCVMHCGDSVGTCASVCATAAVFRRFSQEMDIGNGKRSGVWVKRCDC